MVISIDGLAVNGKTTLAKKIANKIGFKVFSAGTIYRCITLLIIKENIELDKIEMSSILKNINIELSNDKIFLNGEDVTTKIKEEEISLYSNIWATRLKFKEMVRKIQYDFIKKYDVIMEGRDIGTRIAPNAEVKFYLYSDFKTRLNRMTQLKPNENQETLEKNLREIDQNDIERGNFVYPKDAIHIDTTNKTLDEVLAMMLGYIEEILKDKRR